jgi:shikimate dehydrogenase
VLREENWTEFQRLGKVIYLEASPETLIERLTRSSKKRPLLATENWEDKLQDILAARTPLYERADVRVSVDNMNVKEIGAAILALLS